MFLAPCSSRVCSDRPRPVFRCLRTVRDETQSRSPSLLRELLRDVSRSFYLTLRLLPGSVRPQIGLAYLLARATDTIADTGVVPVADRMSALNRLRHRIQGTSNDSLGLERFATALDERSTQAERHLLTRLEEALGILESLPESDRRETRRVLGIITSGQELDLSRFETKRPAGSVYALADLRELDDYTYRVAGCVGEFWTRLCRAHLFPRAPLDELRLEADGVRFGKGLQMVNILRDLPKDLRHGRCYPPADALGKVGLGPSDLLNPGNWGRFRPAYAELLGIAEGHLKAGWNYTNALPRSQVRVRLACALPILLGVRTLALLKRANPLDATQRVKVSRAEVSRLMRRMALRYPFPGAWDSLFETSREG